MKGFSPKILIFQAALFLTLVVSILIHFFGTNPLFNSYEYLLYLLIFISVYGFLYVYIRLFIYKRIEKVYHAIFPENRDFSPSDILETSNLKWAEGQVAKLEEKRANEISALKEREKFQKEFIGNLAHELKTPVFNIQGYVLTLLEGGIDDKTINVPYLQRTEKSIDRMIQILEDLDEISKYDSSRMNLQMKSFDLGALVEDITLEFKLSIDQASKNIKQTIHERFTVYADRKRIKQVIVNLLANSIKYGKENGTITISASEINKKVIVKISDDGPGIDEKHLSRIFERFYRVEESRARSLGGSGLGLAIVKSIMDAHNETIHVNSKINVGTTFSFSLAINQ